MSIYVNGKKVALNFSPNLLDPNILELDIPAWRDVPNVATATLYHFPLSNGDILFSLSLATAPGLYAYRADTKEVKIVHPIGYQYNAFQEMDGGCLIGGSEGTLYYDYETRRAELKHSYKMMSMFPVDEGAFCASGASAQPGLYWFDNAAKTLGTVPVTQTTHRIMTVTPVSDGWCLVYHYYASSSSSTYYGLFFNATTKKAETITSLGANSYDKAISLKANVLLFSSAATAMVYRYNSVTKTFVNSGQLSGLSDYIVNEQGAYFSLAASAQAGVYFWGHDAVAPDKLITAGYAYSVAEVQDGVLFSKYGSGTHRVSNDNNVTIIAATDGGTITSVNGGAFIRAANATRFYKTGATALVSVNTATTTGEYELAKGFIVTGTATGALAYINKETLEVIKLRITGIWSQHARIDGGVVYGSIDTDGLYFFDEETETEIPVSETDYRGARTFLPIDGGCFITNTIASQINKFTLADKSLELITDHVNANTLINIDGQVKALSASSAVPANYNVTKKAFIGTLGGTYAYGYATNYGHATSMRKDIMTVLKNYYSRGQYLQPATNVIYRFASNYTSLLIVQGEDI